MDRDASARARERLLVLRAERDRLERAVLRPADLVRGSLLERHLGTTDVKRTTPAYYVSVPKEGGGGRMTYVRRADLARVRRGTTAYRERRVALRRLRELADDILREIDALLVAQETPVR
jgi:hypothetical protein